MTDLNRETAELGEFNDDAANDNTPPEAPTEPEPEPPGEPTP